MLGGISSSAGPHAGPNVQGACIPGDTIIKEEPDFFETHCHWIGCDRDLHTQEQLVKVLYKSYYPSIYSSFTSLWYLESPFVFIVEQSKTCSKFGKKFNPKYQLIISILFTASQ